MYNKYIIINCLAVRVGFEPTEPAKVQRFSRPPDSTTLAPHRTGTDLILPTPVDFRRERPVAIATDVRRGGGVKRRAPPSKIQNGHCDSSSGDEDGISAADGPERAGWFEALADGCFTCGFDDA